VIDGERSTNLCDTDASFYLLEEFVVAGWQLECRFPLITTMVRLIRKMLVDSLIPTIVPS
jgi:hypothetical protein